MAKDEQSEKEHFNKLLENADLDNNRFYPTLLAHPDHALLETGISMLGNLKGKK